METSPTSGTSPHPPSSRPASLLMQPRSGTSQHPPSSRPAFLLMQPRSGTSQHPPSSRPASLLMQPRSPALTAPLSLLSLLLVLLLLTQHAAALKCYICNNCIKFELSQSRPCPPEQTKCMKMNMETGQVQRSCGTESMCTDSDTELKTRYTAVSCCDKDNCNSAPRTAVPLPPIMAALLALLLHSRARGWGVN